VGKELNEIYVKIIVVDHKTTHADSTTLNAIVSRIRSQASAPKNEANRIDTLKDKVRELSMALDRIRNSEGTCL
jgi:hypothetical protein